MKLITKFVTYYIWAMPCENMSLGICELQWPRSAGTPAQSDQGLHCLLTESLDTTECMNGEQSPDDTLHMRRLYEWRAKP